MLEYLEGQTLAEKIAAGRLPVGDALMYGTQIADALDKAHRAGIVHRDLKPANVMVTKAGAKLLDFGLAKSAAPVVATSGLSMLPTTPPALTQQGTILGTFQYMAPEQIEGLEADARTDIFAFGALLFEMLTGRTAFAGKTRAALLGAILKDDPPRVSSLVPGTSAAIDRVIGTCLAKDPDDRYQSARDLHRDLGWAASPESAAPGPVSSSPGPARSARGPWLLAAIAMAGFAVASIVAIRHLRETAPVLQSVEFAIPAPDQHVFSGVPGGGTGAATQLAVSPDGQHVAFVTRKDGRFQLWLRSVGSVTARLLPGTDGAAFPFWSPDSRTVAFFADGKLKKMQTSASTALALCDAAGGARRHLESGRLDDSLRACRSRSPDEGVVGWRAARPGVIPRPRLQRVEPSVPALSSRWPALRVHSRDGPVWCRAKTVADQDRIARERTVHRTHGTGIVGRLRDGPPVLSA